MEKNLAKMEKKIRFDIDKGPGSGGSGGCGIDSCVGGGGGVAAGGRNEAPSQSELGPSAGPVPANVNLGMVSIMGG